MASSAESEFMSPLTKAHNYFSHEVVVVLSARLISVRVDGVLALDDLQVSIGILTVLCKVSYTSLVQLQWMRLEY